MPGWLSVTNERERAAARSPTSFVGPAIVALGLGQAALVRNIDSREACERGASMTLRILASAVAGALLLGSASVAGQGTGQWTTGAPMPSERSEVAVAAVGGKIYVVGGFGGQRELEIYDPEADRWERGAAFPRAVHPAAAAGGKGEGYVVGGYADGWTPTDAGF